MKIAAVNDSTVRVSLQEFCDRKSLIEPGRRRPGVVVALLYRLGETQRSDTEALAF